MCSVYMWYEYTCVRELVGVWCLYVCESICEHELLCVCRMCMEEHVCVSCMCVHVFLLVYSCVGACFNMSLLVTSDIMKCQVWSYVHVYYVLQETISLSP